MWVKNNISAMAAMLLTSTALAASHGVPTSIVQPVPMQGTPSVLQPSPTPAAATAQQVSPGLVSAPKRGAPKPVYADTPSATTGVQPISADVVNTSIPYTSMLPKDAEIIPGAPGKNEFFIVAGEDAAKIKKLLDATKPGRDMVAENIKSKQPIVKVKLDESNSTLVSMDVVRSVDEVAKSAIKPSVKLTENDEVLSIFTKNKMTPVGSRPVPAAAPIPDKAKLAAEDIVDDKPMLKLLASTSATHAAAAPTHATAFHNPLEDSRSDKPTKGVMPDRIAMKETIQQPQDKPVALPPASKEAAPTLEMVLQQAKNGGDKVKNETANALKGAVHAANAKINKELAAKVGAKAFQVKAGKATATKSTHKSTAKKTVKEAARTRVTPAAGKVIPYEQIAPKKGPWGSRHAAAASKGKKLVTKKVADKKTASKKMADKNVTTKKRMMNVGVVHSYADYLGKTGHRMPHSTE